MPKTAEPDTSPRSAGPILAALGGIWMLPANLMMWGGDWQGEKTPHHGPGGWALKSFLQIDLADYAWWPAIGILAGPIVLLALWIGRGQPVPSALAWIIFTAGLVNLLIGMGGFLASLFVMAGALVMLGLIPEPPRYS